MSEETKSCPYCGSTIPINVKKCKYCGEWLVIQDKDKPKSSLHIGGFIEAIICIIVIICMFTIGYNDGAMLVILYIYLSLHLYLLPSLIADRKRTQYTAAIFAINLLLGWTVVAWVGSLVWALTLPNLSKNEENENRSIGNVLSIAQTLLKNSRMQENSNSTINESSMNNDIPDNIKQWNWGAFWLSWIWGIGNKSFKTLWALIPYFGFIWMFVCGAKGNEWAWKNKEWATVEEFNKTQKKWAIVGNCIAISIIIVVLLMLILFVSTQQEIKTPLSNNTITIQEPIAEENSDFVDMSEEDYKRFVKENQAKESTSKSVQAVTQPKKQLVMPKNCVVVQQVKPTQTQQHNQEIDDFMN
ncbi:superinfection immunity protein [bacterium]|nr:superinfection immunity protein [bacterium]